MSLFHHSSTYVGIEKTSTSLRLATLLKKSQGWEIAHLREIALEENVNPLDKLPRDAIITTGLSSREVLVRSIEIPLKREKDIQAALAFQVEPLLPYPLEKCILQKTILETQAQGTRLTVFSAKKEAIQHHLELWKTLSIDADRVTSVPQALAAFLQLFPALEEIVFVLHLGEKEGTCALVEKGKVLIARPIEKDLNDIQKTVLAISASFKSKKVETLVFLSEDHVLAQQIQEVTEKTVIFPQLPAISQETIQKFGFAIGMALSGGDEEGCNFRQQEYAYAKPWKKIKKPFLTFCTASLLLFISSIGLTHLFLHKDGQRLEQEFAALLTLENKKEPAALSKEKMYSMLDQLEGEIRSRPDTFPLLPLVPKVGDILAWLSTHPQLVDQEREPIFEIDSFHYVLEKRPEFTHRQEHYSIKIELEFTTANPVAARAFHESLLAPNAFVDAKREMQWTPGKNKYSVSFYLKDKTRYQ